MGSSTETLERMTSQQYKYGFVTDIEQDSVPPGLSEEIIEFISAKTRHSLGRAKGSGRSRGGCGFR